MRYRYSTYIISSRLTFNTAGQFVLLCMPSVNNCLPEAISNLFIEPSQVHSYNRRFSETSGLYIKYSRANHLKYSFSRFGARIWNSIPLSVRVPPKHKFKASSHQFLLYILELEDTYIDTPTLINKLGKMI